MGGGGAVGAYPRGRRYAGARRLPRTDDDTALGGVDVAWGVDEEDVAALEVVNGYARLVARWPGAATITAEAGGRKGAATVAVVAGPLPPVALQIVPQTATLGIDETAWLEAELRSWNGRLLGSPAITWRSSNGPTATVQADPSTQFGIVSSQRAGTTLITATSGDLEATAVVVVRDR